MADIGDLFGSTQSSSFLGVAQGSLQSLDADVAIFGAPCATPYAATGPYAAEAPSALRKAVNRYGGEPNHMDFDLGGPLLGTENKRIVDCGDLPWSESRHSANRHAITAATQVILAAGAVPVVLGGDDSIPIPFFEGYAKHGPLTILQIDAHIDWRDEVNGERFGLSSNMRRASEMDHVEHIVQVGARGIGSARPSDYRDAVDWGVKFVTAAELTSDGTEHAIAQIPQGSQVLINFDVDALDPSIMPAVIGPSPGGLTYRQVIDLIHGTARRATIAGFSIVEFCPSHDPNGIPALVAARVVCNVLGVLARA